MRKFLLCVKAVFALAIIAALIFVLAADVFHIVPSIPSTPPDSSTNPPPPDNKPIEKPDDKPGNNDPPSELPVDPPEETIPDWSIKSTIVKNTLTDTKGNILCESRYSYPYATSNDGSDISAFSEALSAVASEVRDYVNSRVELYKNGSQNDFSVPPQITGYYVINRFSYELFSISFIFSETLPDGSVRESEMHYNLDILLDSSRVTLDAIMNDAISAVNKILSDKKSSGNLTALYDSYEKQVESSINRVWSIRSGGILFSFSAGELAPISSGPIEILIQNSDLSPLLSEYGKILLNITE